MGNQIIQSIKTIAQSLVDKAGYDKTRGGVIVGVNSVTNTYSVKIDGVTYPTVRAVDGATYNVGDVVKVVIPCNQATQMYIASSVLSDNSLGNKIANAVGLAQDAAKVATNYIEQDDTDGLIFGDKTSGTWSGYHSQILPDSFNILDESSTVLASFGPTTIIGEEAKANMRLTFNNLSMLNKENSAIFEVGDLRDASGVATLLFYSKLYTGSNGVVTIDLHVNINSIVSVVVTGATISSSEYSFDGSCITITGLEKYVYKTFEITYTTLSSIPYLTFGTRNNSGKIGYFSSVEGDNLIARGFASHAEGSCSKSTADFSHSEGYNTQANGIYSHAEGNGTIADGDASHAEGKETKTHYAYSHAEGQLSYARGQCSHAEGFNTIAYAYMAHAEGQNTEAHGNESHAEGNHTYAGGKCSHAEGYYTIAGSDYQHVSGKYNEEDNNNLYAFIIGNGTSEGETSNAFAVDWTGNIYMNLRDCTITDSGTALSVTYGASTLDGLLAQAIIGTFSYANAKEILKKRGSNVNMNVKKLLQKIVEKVR